MLFGKLCIASIITLHIITMFTLFIDLNRGYGFRIEEENLEEFGEYLNECCQRMLTHGNSI